MPNTSKRRKPAEDGPRLFQRGRWWAADLRPWGGARPTLTALSGQRLGQRTENKDTALRWAWEHIAKLQAETYRQEAGRPRRLTLADAAEQYLEQAAATREYNTVKSLRTALNHATAAFGSRRLSQITDDELAAWFTALNKRMKTSTLITLRAHIAGFLKASSRPLGRRIELRKEHRQDVDALRDDEIAALLLAAETEVEHRLLRVGLATGARRAELWALEPGDFRSDLRSVRFQRQMAWPAAGTKGLKGKRNRTALVLPGFITAGVQRLPVVAKDRADEMLRSLLQRAGCYRQGRGHHCLRHTYGRLGVERYRWRIEVLQNFLGHAKITTTQVYAHFGQDAAIAEAAGLTYSA